MRHLVSVELIQKIASPVDGQTQPGEGGSGYF
jgi:hypothetical protein